MITVLDLLVNIIKGGGNKEAIRPLYDRIIVSPTLNVNPT
jgi:hypothetical protein